MNIKPLLTIGVPVYNESGRIARCLNSLRENIEGRNDILIRISDNASTDTTVSEIQPFLKDPRFQLEIQPNNIGTTANFESLLEKAESEFFMWFCGDDRFANNAIVPLIEVMLKAPEVVLAYGRTIFSFKESTTERLMTTPVDHFNIAEICAYGLPTPCERVLGAMVQNQGFDYAFYGVSRTKILRQIMLHQMKGMFIQAEGIMASLLVHGRFSYVPESILIKGKVQETQEQRRRRYQAAIIQCRSWSSYNEMREDMNLHLARDYRSALAEALEDVPANIAKKQWRRFNKQVRLCYGGVVVHGLRKVRLGDQKIEQLVPSNLPRTVQRIIDMIISGFLFGPNAALEYFRRRSLLKRVSTRVNISRADIPGFPTEKPNI